MINKDVVSIIQEIDPEYVVGGSNAIMVHLGKDIRECKDIDLHLSKSIDEQLLNKIAIPSDVFYDSVPFNIFNGIRVLQLERIIANKINRLNSKDVYDLFFILDLKYDIELVKIGVKHREKVDEYGIEPENYNPYYKINIKEAISKINRLLEELK